MYQEIQEIIGSCNCGLATQVQRQANVSVGNADAVLQRSESFFPWGSLNSAFKVFLLIKSGPLHIIPLTESQLIRDFNHICQIPSQ